mmetsp:Transcript_376/g.1428  ORF Transcript_376/g.1428 Transcript_376/m.1428 type:complete len:86 (-) Transcript_376:167-424(-)
MFPAQKIHPICLHSDPSCCRVADEDAPAFPILSFCSSFNGLEGTQILLPVGDVYSKAFTTNVLAVVDLTIGNDSTDPYLKQSLPS